LPLGKLDIWEVATWENTLGKLPLGKKSFGKKPNIEYIHYRTAGGSIWFGKCWTVEVMQYNK